MSDIYDLEEKSWIRSDELQDVVDTLIDMLGEEAAKIEEIRDIPDDHDRMEPYDPKDQPNSEN
jgi:hypothetical protein